MEVVDRAMGDVVIGNGECGMWMMEGILGEVLPWPTFGLLMAGFLVVWVGMHWLLVGWSGWRALAKAYPMSGSGKGVIMSWRSVKFGEGAESVWMKGCVNVQVGVEGIGMWMTPEFRFGAPPMMIPWGAVAYCQREKRWWWEVTLVEARDAGKRIMFDGAVGRRVWRVWQAWEESQKRDV
jgi:hypothetical protein